MEEADWREYILRTCPGATVLDAVDGRYFFNDPERMHPFATIVAGDEHDQASDLSRPGVFRLNIGVGKDVFQSLFGSEPAQYDFTVLDHLLPHPVYGNTYWVCVLNPGPATAETVRSLLAEAYAADRRRRVGPE
ncbi:MAG: DUF6194 family protein [Planctomycetia bacterium]